MIVRKAAAAAVATVAIGLPLGAAHAAPTPAPSDDAIPNDPVTRPLEDPAGDVDSAGLWVGVVTGASGLAALAFSVRRPRVAR